MSIGSQIVLFCCFGSLGLQGRWARTCGGDAFAKASLQERSAAAVVASSRARAAVLTITTRSLQSYDNRHDHRNLSECRLKLPQHT